MPTISNKVSPPAEREVQMEEGAVQHSGTVPIHADVLPRTTPHLPPHSDPHSPILQARNEENRLENNIKQDNLFVAAYRIRVGPPQFIRISGLHNVFQRYQNYLDQEICVFGTAEVPCRCDTLLGAVECDLPRFVTTAVVALDDRISVRVRIADFESSPLSFRYHSTDARDLPKSEATFLFPGTDPRSANISYYGFGDDESKSVESGSDKGGQKGNGEHDSDSSEVANHRKRNRQHMRVLKMIRRENASKRGGRTYYLLHQCIAELVGTMFIVIFGVGAVISAIVFDVADLWHVTVLWGFGIAFAILVAGSISEHI